MSISDEEKLDDQQLALMYLRDIAIVRELDLADEGIVLSVLDEPPNTDEIQAIIQKREEEMLLNGTSLFETGVAKITKELPKIRAALVAE